MGNLLRKEEEIEREEKEIDEHKIPIEELFQRLTTNPDTGLSMTEARQRYERDGPNAVTPPKHFYKAKNASLLDMINNLVPQYALCLRDGEQHKVAAKELCVGDIIEVKSGDTIPADIRIIEEHGFKVDMSSLTGESEPQSRSPECSSENPLETKNLAFLSTKAVEGTCKGIVFAIGDSTIAGPIAGLASILS